MNMTKYNIWVKHRICVF